MEEMTSMNTKDVEKHKSHEKVARIYQAIKGEHVGKTFFENLLRREGDINYRILEGSNEVPNLLDAAYEIRESSNSVFGLLLDYGVDFTFKDKQGRTLVHKIIEKKSLHDGELPMDRTFSDEHVDAILNAHVNFNNILNPCDNNGLSHFHAACITNNSKAVEFYLKNGVDVNEAVNTDSTIFPLDTPLHLAVKYTCPNVLEILLNHGANVHLKNADGLSPLHLIVERAIEKCQRRQEPRFVRTLNSFVKFVIDNEIDTDEFGFCKLHLACLVQDESIIQRVLEQITDINQTINLNSPICPGFIPLHFSTFSNVQIFKLLLENGADIDDKNTRMQTPFDLCLKNFTIDDIFSIIISKNEWKDIVLSDNKTKLLEVVSAMENIDEFTSFLKLTKCPINAFIPVDSSLWPGYTILHLAVVFTKTDSNSTEIVAECLKRGADMTKSDVRGSTALHLAFYMQKLPTVNYMLEHYESPNNPIDKDNLSHFHIACAADHLKSVKHFLSKGVNINEPVYSTFRYCTDVTYNIRCFNTKIYTICPGSTALHINIASGRTHITEILLKNGADVYAQDVNGFTPVHRLLNWAYCKPWVGIGNSIVKLGQLKNVTAKCGLSHLHVACYFRHHEAIVKLLEIGADLKAIVSDTKLKDYDDINCGSFGNYGKRYSYLSEFIGCTPFDFLCHAHKLYYKFDCKKIMTTRFMLLERYKDVLVDKDKKIPFLEKLLRKIDRCHCVHVKWQNNVASPFLEQEFGVTTLHLACRFADVKLVEDSLHNGTNVNAKVNSKSPIWQGLTPLHIAVKQPIYNDIEKNSIDNIIKIVKLLMQYGADPFLVDDNNNNTPLHEIGRIKINPNISDFEPRGLLHNSGIRSTDFLAIYSLIAIIVENTKKFEVNQVNDQNLSLFHVACITLKKFAVEQLLKNGVDVDQAISDFSDFFPGSTPLHLFIDYFKFVVRDQSTVKLSSYGSNDETFLEILDLLIQNGANVNTLDTFGETPLHKAARSKILRRILIEKMISNGANVHTINMHGNTAFELLLREGDVALEEIDLFLKFGCHWNAYSSITREGYIALIFRFQLREELASNNIMENPVFVNILNNSEIAKINSIGRTALHNVVCFYYTSLRADESHVRVYRSQTFYFWRTAEEKAKKMYDYEPTTYKDYYKDLIEQLVKRGCDIDHEDDEGQTALHLAVIFQNDRAIVPLLKMGADINIIDRNGKTAFNHCLKFSGYDRISWSRDYLGEQDGYCHSYINKTLARHICKLEFCGQRVSNENKLLHVEMSKTLGPVRGTAWDCFQAEIEVAKNINIGTTKISLYDFLMNSDTEMLYMDMTSEERSEFDQFFENIGKHSFNEIDCLIKLKYRQSIERLKLIGPATSSMNLLVKCQLPDVCSRIISKFLKNEDLKRLIVSTAILDR